MIAQFGQHLRKWLTGLARVVRNQAQAVVAKMESVEAAAAEGAHRSTAPGAANPARSGEPPAHWVQLVERHAPELLLPGPPDTVPRASPPVFETDAAGEPSAGDRTPDPMSANAAPDADKSLAHEGSAVALKLPRLARKHRAPSGRRPPPMADPKRPTRDSDRPAESAVEPPRGDAGSQAPEAASTGSAKVQRAAVPAANAEKKRRRRSLSLQPNTGTEDPRAPGPGTRKTEAPVARTSPALRFGSAAGRIAKKQPVKRESQFVRPGTGEDSRTTSRTGPGAEPIDRPAENRQTGLQRAVGTPAPAAIKHAGAFEKVPRPHESASGRPSLSDFGLKTAAAPIKGNGHDRRPVQEVRLINGQHPGRPPEEREIGGPKRARPPEFHWPDLPGENRSDDDRASDGGAAWPSLPQAPLAAAGSWRPQPRTRLREDESRASERLRRLDEEQRGISWSGSPF